MHAGPYGMLLPPTMFKRNPGLQLKRPHIRIGFQPEIGSTSAPTYKGLLRFMGKEEADGGYPGQGSDTDGVGPSWDFHKFQSWYIRNSDNSSYDFVYSYFEDSYRVNASEWCAAAQLAAHVQYQTMFSAFIGRAFQYTTGVVLWKSQSPWPALRGFLYDWYLESTGTLRGVRAALQSSVSVALDMSLWRTRIINRRIDPLTSSERIGARYDWISLNGEILESGEVLVAEGSSVVPPMSSALLGAEALKWPRKCSDVCFLKLQPLPSTLNFEAGHSPTWYWLTNPNLSSESDFSALGAMRRRQAVTARLSVPNCTISHSSSIYWVVIQVEPLAQDALFYPFLSVNAVGIGPLLPIIDDHETDVVIVPGESQTRRLVFPGTGLPSDSQVQVTMDSWNAPSSATFATCSTIK